MGALRIFEEKETGSVQDLLKIQDKKDQGKD